MGSAGMSGGFMGNQVEDKYPWQAGWDLVGTDYAQENSGINDFANQAKDVGQKELDMADPNSQLGSDLWGMTERNWEQANLPKYTAAGVMTSGPGIKALSEGTSDLATKMEEQQVKQYQDAAAGWAQLQQMPLKLRQELFATMMGQKGSGYEQQSGNVNLQGSYGAGGSGQGMCWVARAVYGDWNPKWKLFRRWLLTKAPSLLRWTYARYGERIAEYIKDKPKMQASIRYFMDIAIGVA
jgi:hypothetical protein